MYGAEGRNFKCSLLCQHLQRHGTPVLRFHPKHPQLSHLKVERSAKEHPLPILTSLVRRGQGTSGVPTHILLLMKRAH